MKLQCGKDHKLDLEHVPLNSRVIRGVRIFEPKRTSEARAAYLTNTVVARTFQKAVGAADMSARIAIGAHQVQAATFRDETGKLRVVYREAIVRFEAGTSQAKRRAILAKFRLKIRARNRFVADQVTVFDPRRAHVAEGMIELANRLTETDEITFAFPNFVSEFKRMGIAPGLSEHWQLDIAEVRKAWRYTHGEGITIAIIDDGVDVEHPNLRSNIRRHPDPDERRDLCGRDFFIDENDRNQADHFDPRPKIFRHPFDDFENNDIHGTCCAGVAAASGKVARVYGVAPRARILPIKIMHGSAMAVEAHVANALRYASRFADILSCSWEGPRGPDMEAALKEAGAGRGGKGCPIFVAAGNEQSTVTYPATSPHAIAVGASTYKEKRASYSNRGNTLAIMAPSGPVIELPFRKPRPGMIFTTDLSYPHRGFNIGSREAGGMDGVHYNKFTGTSSATPFTAGVAALMLSANPKLTSQQVRVLLQATAEKIGPKRTYNAKGHSREFGFGRVNAARAVAQALKMAATTRRRDTRRPE